jgi:uncharacterized protein YjdB
MLQLAREDRASRHFIAEVSTLVFLIAGLSGCGGGTLNPNKPANQHQTLTSLTISPANPVVPIGDSEKFVVTGTFADQTTEDVTSSVTWSAADPTIASVNSSGIAAAHQPGSTMIVATSGTVTGKVLFTVPAAGLLSITLTSQPSVPKGSTVQLAATGSFADGSSRDMTSVTTWTSSDPTIATVNNSGLATGVNAGSVTITASNGTIRGAATLTVIQPTLISLAISPATAVIAKGRTQQFSVAGSFSDGSTQDVTGIVAWSVSAGSVASVNSTGLLTSSSQGTATLTATSGSISTSALITVSAPALTSLSITPSSPSLVKGTSQQLAVSGSFSDGSTQTVTNSAAWTVSPPTVASVSNSGLLNALANGMATVTATVGSVSGSDQITVSSASLTSIVISPVTPTLISGKTQQLTATGSYNDGTTQDITSKVSWSGSATGIVGVSASGLVTATGPGTATISATSGTISSSDKITVTQTTLVSIAITPANVSVPKGETEQLTATGSYNDGSTQDLSNQVTWAGAVPGIVDIGINGLITARGVGSATITATDGPVSAATLVTVSAAVPISLTVFPLNASVYPGTTQKFTVYEILSDGSKRNPTTGVTWSSANPDIATISANGLASGVAEGSASINASYQSVSGSTVLTVKPIDYVVTETRKAGSKALISYFDRSNIPGVDEAVRIANPGINGQDLCAMVYVFSADQQMSECCGCHISRNGLLTLSINNDLTSNPLTGRNPATGTVSVLPSDVAGNPSCDPTIATPEGALTVWSTHLQSTAPDAAPTGGGSSTFTPPTNLAPISFQNQCLYVQRLGSGQGTCTCGTGEN